MLHCTYGGEECKEKNFQLYQHPEFFNCWTFLEVADKEEEEEEEDHLEAGGHEDEEEEGHGHRILTGPNSGLSLILYAEHVDRHLDHYDFEHILINSEGIRVLIHEPKTFPSQNQLGFNIPPGESVSVLLKTSIRHRLGKPYSSCIPSKEIFPGVKYSVDACYGQCLINAIEKECSCHTTKGTYIITKENESLLHCLSVRDGNISAAVSRKLCENKVMKKFNYEINCKHCDWPCIEWDFSSTVSHSEWPLEHTNMDLLDMVIMKKPRGEAYENLKSYIGANDTEMVSIFQILEEKLEGPLHKEEHAEAENDVNETEHEAEEQLFEYAQRKSFEWTKKNLLYLNVYFKDDSVEYREQQPSYNDGAFWSDVGGAMGLWAGLSVITVTETLSFIARICYSRWRSEKKVKITTSQDISTG